VYRDGEELARVGRERTEEERAADDEELRVLRQREEAERRGRALQRGPRSVQHSHYTSLGPCVSLCVCVCAVLELSGETLLTARPRCCATFAAAFRPQTIVNSLHSVSCEAL
uniref:Uncharacterized protein n=1 Tax=Callorhinchus milii TaxID=7868 RepID=A0A4W3GPK6_CALMI